ncbi:hypothetical protein E2C01_065084 [Portunus trituberculatus]|uniref:Uncharacterized protein n=1 Tax=Portunus trituberculatus TaxID=210409 RepID=A0A5B7HQS6_PORTR|nr:hypothetical protein [Portunus trituberculatus]
MKVDYSIREYLHVPPFLLRLQLRRPILYSIFTLKPSSNTLPSPPSVAFLYLMQFLSHSQSTSTTHPPLNLRPHPHTSSTQHSILDLQRLNS